MPMLLALPFLLASAAAAQVDPLFDTWIAYDAGTQQTGRQPESIATGDIDGDGDPDAVMSKNDWATKNFAVFRNDGNGTFLPRKTYSTLLAAGEVALGDVDGDQDLDVIIADAGQYGDGQTVSVYLNDGQGIFGARKTYNCGTGPFGLALADFDADGDLDLAVANYGFYGWGNGVTILANDGQGAFTKVQTVATGTGPRKVAAADLDGDGDIDLAVSQDASGGEQTRMSVLLNDGAGQFSVTTYDAKPPENWADNRWSCIAVGDMDNDGDPDILFSSVATWDGKVGAFWLFKNAGDGTFAQKEYIPFGLPYDNGVVSLQVADLDGNGWLDIVAAKFSDVQNGAYWVVLRTDQGGYPKAVPYVAGQGVFDIAIADVNLDARPDILCCNYYSIGMSVHLNQGGGKFPRATLSETDPFQGGMAAADIDGDGDLDVATSGGIGVDGLLTVMGGQGDGTFGAPKWYLDPRLPGEVQLVDLNGDGSVDLLWGDFNAPNGVPLDCHWRANDGNGNFGDRQTIVMDMGEITDVVPVDLNRDGWIDIVAPDAFREEVEVALNQGGSFSAGRGYSAPGGVAKIATGDFNGDAYPDLALSAPIPYGYGNTVDVLLNDGAGGFGPAQVYTVDDGPGPIVAADLTGDGILDLATANGGFQNDPTPSMSVLVGKGDGTFKPEVRYSNSNVSSQTHMVAADADHDGDIDLLVMNYSANDVSFIPNDGTGKLLPNIRYGIGTALTDMVYADFTGDGVADLAAMSTVPTPLRSYVAIVPGVGGACEADIDGNGILDLFDFLGFQNLFNAKDARADITADGVFDLFDFLAYQNLFVAGC